MKKMIGLLMAVVMISGLAVYSATAAEDGAAGAAAAEDTVCVDCGKHTDNAYLLSDGVTVSHICDECSGKCMVCGAPATQHYERYQHVTFVCDGCYELTAEQ